jgi:serine/threonine protein kinase
VDEIEESSSPVTIVLRHLQSDLYEIDRWKPLNWREIKHVSRCVLEALQVLHEDGYVHTGKSSCYGYVDAKLNIILDVKPHNIFVNLQECDMRFSEVRLGDLGGTSHVDSKWATSRTLVGNGLWASPEVWFEMPWNTAADIWSFGAVVRIIFLTLHCSAPAIPPIFFFWG